MLRVHLIRHGATSATRRAAFGNDEGLEPRARADAEALSRRLPPHPTAFSGPERACVETAAALGLDAEDADELAGLDMGSWAGMTLDDLQARDPAGLMTWMSDPDAAPHGGESLVELGERVQEWLEGLDPETGFVVAVVDAAVVKSAVVAALDAPALAFWRLDVAPLGVSELHGRGGRWTVRSVNAPLG